MACPKCGLCNTGCPGKTPCKCSKQDLTAFYLASKNNAANDAVVIEQGLPDPGKVSQYNVFDNKGIPLTPMRKQQGGKREKVE